MLKCADRGAGGRGGRRFDAETDLDLDDFDWNHNYNHNIDAAGDLPAEDN